jgi:hypothetical protein
MPSARRTPRDSASRTSNSLAVAPTGTVVSGTAGESRTGTGDWVEVRDDMLETSLFYPS